MRFGLAQLVLVPLAVSCAGKVESGGTVTPGIGPSGVEGTRTASSLDDAERKQFCDWAASLFGGYGHVERCGMGVYAGYFYDVDHCLSTQFGDCPVRYYEDCAISYAKVPRDQLCSTNIGDVPYCHQLIGCYK